MNKLVVQIQTFDGCNASCYKCPTPFLYHSYKPIDDDLFVKIVAQLYNYESLRIALYLQNEPLLDPLLFKRAKFLKKVFGSRVELEISTNCLLLPKYKDQIIENFDIIILSLQAWNCDIYNRIHRLNIDEVYFNKIISAFEEIKKLKDKQVHAKQFSPKILEGKDINDVNAWYPMAYSRAGFLSGDKIIYQKIKGCRKNKHHGISILYDGTVILCCMDYLRQAVVGNLNHQTINEIINSQLYQRYILAVEGKIETPPDFICKKCELANEG